MLRWRSIYAITRVIQIDDGLVVYGVAMQA